MPLPRRKAFATILWIASAVLAESSVGQGAISLSASGPAVAGQDICFTVTPPGGGSGGGPPRLVVEINGVTQAPVSAPSSEPTGDGSYTWCFRIPMAASGGCLSVTAIGDGQFTSSDLPIL